MIPSSLEENLLKKESALKGKKLLLQVFLLRVDPHWERKQNEKWQTSPTEKKKKMSSGQSSRLVSCKF